MTGGNDARRDGNSVTTLVGVSNVDFKTVVPLVANPSTGRLLVDLAGGVYPNTLSMEVPAGTVNGVNTIFTVQNVPIQVEVSGQGMVSQSQDSQNYGFTITGSSAPYTMTFVNAPTQNPHSYYNIGASGSGSAISTLFQTDDFTATSGQTAFTASKNVTSTEYVAQNGVILKPSSYSATSTTLTLNSGAVAGDDILWRYITT